MAAAIGYLSDQKTNAAASPPVLNPASEQGSLQRIYFSFTAAVALVAASPDYVDLITMPKGARFWGGAFFSTHATALFDFGDGTTVNLYGNAVDGTISLATFGLTPTLKWGTVLATDVLLRMTADTANFSIADVVTGYVDLQIPGL
ncbi:MAG: hypothetical protein E4H01_07335 [Lysobacterales bacterium]|nr:MAG: hypothetical protein E4H01_07335 [Xanthomonadales bacterium]